VKALNAGPTGARSEEHHTAIGLSLASAISKLARPLCPQGEVQFDLRNADCAPKNCRSTHHTHTPHKWQISTDLDPLLLLFSKHAFFDHLGLNRNTGQAFETQPDVAVKLTFSLSRMARQKMQRTVNKDRSP
jgi:hypothetical protein